MGKFWAGSGGGGAIDPSQPAMSPPLFPVSYFNNETPF